jgi:hypothetical protein
MALAFVCLPTALAFPCIVIGLLALPLCGAALTFFAAGVCQGSCRVNRYAACLYISAEARVRSGFR